MSRLEIEDSRIVWRYRHQTLVVEPWGPDSLRVRATLNAAILDLPGALLPPVATDAKVEKQGNRLVLVNGRVRVELDHGGRLRFFHALTGEVLLEEKALFPPGPGSHLPGRRFRHLQGENYALRQEFHAQEGERFHGLGQQRVERLDLKGCAFDLHHHNTVFTIPFLVSSRKYGLLWHHPGTGNVELANNRTLWTADSAKQIDYWFTVGDSHHDLQRNYARATGFAPMMPDWAAGFWQCKLRYKTRDELLEAAREYKRRGLPLDVIVIDFYHWPDMGDWKLDPRFWPDPAGMVRELDSMGVRLMVSFWPTVDTHSENFLEMQERGFLVRNEKGFDEMQRFILRDVADEHATGAGKKKDRSYIGFYDATHPEARTYVWSKLQENYCRHGIKLFWLDCNEPELKHFDHDQLRYHLGNGAEVTGLYPNSVARTVFEGLQAAGETEIITLARSGWAGIQRYGAMLWPGDIFSTWEEFRLQVGMGLNASMSGLPWWHTDIGGFIPPEDYKGNPAFTELLLRWFQYGTFSPVMRNHGMRDPNEIWSFGEEADRIMAFYLHLRQRLKPYILEQMHLAHKEGITPMRPLFVDFEDDPHCADLRDQYLFGPDLLVAPVLEPGATVRRVYLPAGRNWHDVWTGRSFSGGQWVEVEAPLDRIPVFSSNPDLLEVFSPEPGTSQDEDRAQPSPV